MIVFYHDFCYYIIMSITFNILQPNYKVFEENLHSVQDPDAFLLVQYRNVPSCNRFLVMGKLAEVFENHGVSTPLTRAFREASSKHYGFNEVYLQEGDRESLPPDLLRDLGN